MKQSYKAISIKHLLVPEHYDYETDKRAPVVDFTNGFV
jgi:hypothetical protein